MKNSPFQVTCQDYSDLHQCLEGDTLGATLDLHWLQPLLPLLHLRAPLGLH